jgi:hypothetical protein
MRLMTVALLFVSLSASAGEYVSRSFSMSLGGMGWNTTFYNCNALEDLVEGHLEDLGAANVRVRCVGGLEQWGNPSPAHVTARFDAPVPMGTTTETLTLKSRPGDSCEAHVATLDRALPLFPGVKILSRTAQCNSGRTGRWAYSITVTE